MKTWKCPRCKKIVRAIGVEVTHKCPGNRNLVTAFELVKEMETEE